VGYLRRHSGLRTIVVTGFWSKEATGRSYRHVLRVDVDGGYDGSGAAYNPIAFHHALDRLVKMFPDRRFILLDDIPTGSALSMREYARVLYASGSTGAAGLPRGTADAQRASYEPILKSVAAARNNVVYVPVLWQLCASQVCPLFRRNGLLLYRNGDHLTRAASESLAPALDVIFGSRPRDAPISEGVRG
jgi:hypothetical protein